MFIFSFCLLVKMNWFYKLGFVFLILIVDKGEFVINLVEYKEKFAKLSYLLL